jgi:translation initiation factor IF-3
VRCVGSDGEMLGVMKTSEAMKLAQAAGQDLVEISPNAEPPVCRIMDFGQYRYQESMKRKQTRKQQVNRAVKEIKFHANVAEHDFQTKLNHIRKFLEKGHKVKVSLAFRGRENAHRELGFEVIGKVIEGCKDIAVVDSQPRLMGRNIICMLGVKSKK